ncbi:acyl-CoA thioesterase [Aromatoleum evansii]|uniref:acyl-CoA thioesterase n=1 Tax=Aromatoleum evansii TaxID=59406 RepID=UPI00145DAFD5|nr:thioesterase family protein [Aromatoleum evansii]NMG29911.1 thioesterase [Aromatoleum evansii]
MAMVETARGTVYEWQRDHMGHINVRAYLDLFDAACWQFYGMVGLGPSRLRSGELKLAAVQQNVSYMSELYPGDTVFVRTGVVEMREKVIRFRHELVSVENGELSAVCEFTAVCLDPETRRSRPFPADVAERAHGLMLPAEG